MFDHKKFRGFISLILILSALLAACSPKAPAVAEPVAADSEQANTGEATAEEPASKPESITINVQAGAPEVAVYKPLSQAWEEKTGIKVNWIEVSQDVHHDKLITEFSTQSGAFDVIGLDQPWVAEFAAAGYLEPLDGYISAEDKADFFPAYLQLESYNGNLYGIPHYMFAPIMFYRPDLLEKYGIRIPSLDEPMTKDEFINACQAIREGEGADVYGTIVEAKRHVVPVIHFAEAIYREGGTLIDEQGNPHFNEAPAVAALQLLSDLVNEYKCAPAGALGFDNVDNHTLMQNGKLGMAINWPYAFSLLNDPASSQVIDKFDTTIPWKGVKSTTIVGGWALGIPADSKNKEWAWDFIEFMTNTENLYQLRKGSFGPPSRASEMDSLMADTTITPLMRNAMASMSKAVENGSLLPQIPEWNQIQDRLNIALQEAVGLQKTPQQALDDAQADILVILGK
ncbi:MAG: extracellular solute-binding protein [Anaerolineaceae bacterium]|nr:extracellular solute-binding protein [Anaerolineaceae bacterium]